MITRRCLLLLTLVINLSFALGYATLGERPVVLQEAIYQPQEANPMLGPGNKVRDQFRDSFWKTVRAAPFRLVYAAPSENR